MSVRKAAVASQFYPGNEQMLKQSVLEYLQKTKIKDFSGRLKALIVPHAGYMYSGQVAASAYKVLKAWDQNNQRKWKVLLLGPAHYFPFSGAAAPVHDQWETPLGLVDVKDVRREIEGECSSIVDVPEAGIKEHSLEVQIPFLQTVLKDFVLYPLVLGNVRADDLAGDLLDFCRGEDVIVVVSSDLSHFMDDERARNVDMATCEAIKDMNIDAMIEKGDACGRFGILTLMFIAEKLGWKPQILDYKNSSDVTGDEDRVVGYSAFGFWG